MNLPVKSATTSTLLTLPFTYVVCYELSQQGNYYTLLAEELSRSEKWCHILPAVWFVVRREPLADLVALLRTKMYKGDKLFVFPAMGPTGGDLPKDAWDWVNQNFPKWW